MDEDGHLYLHDGDGDDHDDGVVDDEDLVDNAVPKVEAKATLVINRLARLAEFFILIPLVSLKHRLRHKHKQIMIQLGQVFMQLFCNHYPYLAAIKQVIHLIN